MKNVQIRDVPDDIHAILTQRAESENKSLQAFLADVLATEARKSETASFLRHLARKHTGPDRISTEEIVALIREGRDS